MCDATSEIQSAGDILEKDGMENVNSDFILEGTVLVIGKEKHLKLTHSSINLSPSGTSLSKGKTKVLTFTWQDVICAVKDIKSPGNQQAETFTLHYIQHQTNKKLQAQVIKITDTNKLGDKWVDAINEKCQKVSGRPKKAFVIVNPIGGAKRGQQIYTKTVAPLFELAGIHTTVAFTERSKHGQELGESQDFSGYDVIVTVGGDGLYQEVLLGLTLQTQNKHAVDYNNPDTTFVKPDIPLAIIPAGTGNAVAGWCSGIVDEESAVLNIIRGKTAKCQILTVHSREKFITVSAMHFGYGEWSRVIKKTDGLRWMGRMRYPYAIIACLMTKPVMVKCKLEYCPADQPEELQDEASQSNTGDSVSGSAPRWIEHPGSSSSVACLLAFACETIRDKSRSLLNPRGTNFDLLVDYGCKHLDFYKAIFKLISGTNIMDSMPAKLEFLCGLARFRLKVILDEEEEASPTASAERQKIRELAHLLNIDGEIVQVEEPEVEVRVHPEFVSLYGMWKPLEEIKSK